MTWLLYQRWVYRRLPESWRAYLLRRSMRKMAAAMTALGVSIERATVSLNRFRDAFGRQP